jgi:hypothetical protein
VNWKIIEDWFLFGWGLEANKGEGKMQFAMVILPPEPLQSTEFV